MAPTMSYNKDNYTIEIHFPYIPSKSVRRELHSFGFNYHRENNLWYAKHSEESEKFAQSLCGVKELTKETSDDSKLYRYYSRRPVDLGTYPKRDMNPVNIVNFDNRVPVEDGSITAWGYVEYTAPLKQSDIDQYELTPAPEKDAASDNQKNSKIEQKINKVKNTFAEHYSSVGTIPILENADFNLFDQSVAYIKDLNILYRRMSGGDSIYITDLENASKNGKTCAEYSLYRRDHSNKDPISLHLINNYDIKTVSELHTALKDNRDLGFEVQIVKRERKGVETFSPFAEIKPVTKIPERWNKRNFANAILSGQIYYGQIDERLTDDYAYDAAMKFNEGVPLNIPYTAREIVEDWSDLNSVRSKDIHSDGTCKIDFYNGYSTSKTFYFDLNCDIKEGKRREDERLAGIKKFNDMMVSLCIKVSPEDIDPSKIYTVTTLDRYTNSGIHASKTENVQGYVLRDRLDPDSYFADILGIEEMDIQPEQIYSVANFYHRRDDNAEPDDRVIECGNWKQIVTGKALLEMTSEGVYFPTVTIDTCEYSDYSKARKTLENFASGSSKFMLGNNQPDYSYSIKCLDNEYARANEKHSLDDVIHNAQKKNVLNNSVSTKERTNER